MRLAMAISPSRVSSSTVPISRMYMRTGSVVRPPSASSAVSAAAASSARGVVVACAAGVVRQQQRLGIGRNFVHLDAHAVDHADDVFDLLRIDDVVGQVIVDLGVGQVALLQALADQLLDFGLLGLVVLVDRVRHGATHSESGENRQYRRGVKDGLNRCRD